MEIIIEEIKVKQFVYLHSAQYRTSPRQKKKKGKKRVKLQRSYFVLWDLISLQSCDFYSFIFFLFQQTERISKIENDVLRRHRMYRTYKGEILRI